MADHKLKDEKHYFDEDDGTIENVDELPVHLAEDVSYGPGGVAGVIQSPYVLAAAFLASFGGFSFGYGTLIMHSTLESNS